MPMKTIIYVLVLQFACLLSVYAGESNKSMPNIAFRALQAGDMKLAVSILPKEADAYAYIQRNKQKLEKRIGRSLTEEDMKKGAKKEEEKTRKKVKRQIDSIRKTLKEKGFDISKAILVSVLDKSGQKYTDNPKEAKVDIYLHLKEGNKDLVIMLDDCIFGVSERKLGDGYRLQD